MTHHVFLHQFQTVEVLNLRELEIIKLCIAIKYNCTLEQHQHLVVACKSLNPEVDLKGGTGTIAIWAPKSYSFSTYEGSAR